MKTLYHLSSAELESLLRDYGLEQTAIEIDCSLIGLKNRIYELGLHHCLPNRKTKIKNALLKLGRNGTLALSRGKTQKQVAEELGIHVSTWQSHLARLGLINKLKPDS